MIDKLDWCLNLGPKPCIPWLDRLSGSKVYLPSYNLIIPLDQSVEKVLHKAVMEYGHILLYAPHFENDI